MREKRHKVAVLIARAQGFHDGHAHILKSIEGEFDSVLMLVGSAYRPRSWKNPFSFAERADFIRAGTKSIDIDLSIVPLVDTLYNDRSWASNVRAAVRFHLRQKDLDPAITDIVLTGFEKDQSSAYQGWFPEWGRKPIDPFRRNGALLNATDLRNALFLSDGTGLGQAGRTFGEDKVSNILHWMDHNPRAVAAIRAEAEHCRESKARIATAAAILGYPVVLNTVDAVVVMSGHVLLVRRDGLPGKGTLALPGGHVMAGKSGEESILEILRQRARLDMPKGLLANRIRSRRVFDHPERSERGWVRTEAFMFEFEDRPKLEKITQTPDRTLPEWVPIANITPDEMFEDHFDIIQSFVPELSGNYASILMAHAGGHSNARA